MGKSPDSGPSRQLIVNSNRYGLTKGSAVSEHLELTPDGRQATGVDVPPGDKLKARFKLAIENIAPFKSLFDSQKGSRLPAQSILEDQAKEQGIPQEERERMCRNIHSEREVRGGSENDLRRRADYSSRTSA